MTAADQFDKRSSSATFSPQPPTVLLDAVCIKPLNSGQKEGDLIRGKRRQLEGHKKVYGHREGRAKKREEKRSHLKQSSVLANEVMKGCFESTLETIGSYPVSSCKSLIKVGGSCKTFGSLFCAPVQLENSLIQWKSLEGGLLGLFVHILLILSQCS